MSGQRPILVLDFGSQFTQLIARRLREMQIYCEIHSYQFPIEKIRSLNPYGIILSGGPSSVTDLGAPKRSIQELQQIAPLLGICYGMQLIAVECGGTVQSAQIREYGLQKITWKKSLALATTQNTIVSLDEQTSVWMSHGDVVGNVPVGFEPLAISHDGAIAAMIDSQTIPRLLAFQFHPEVTHTHQGRELLKYFALEMCHAPAVWTSDEKLEEVLTLIQKQVAPNEKVLCALSGGVDSTVAAVALTKALGFDRVRCVFVNNGLLRLHEYEDVMQSMNSLGLNVESVDASHAFLSELAGVEDPEKKRKIIGRVFIEVFEKAVDTKEYQWLAQGTLYPDVIESVNLRGQSVTIKTHHNVGGLPAQMKMKVIEPFRELFKDEVRELGRRLNLSENVLMRHPFPGPGLAIRVLGAVSEERLKILKEADHIWTTELKKHELYQLIWQAFCVLLPIKTVGVQGDSRSYENVLCLRAVTSEDGMTADWFSFEPHFLKHVANRITNQIKGINRVVYDVTSKPPATIEWE